MSLLGNLITQVARSTLQEQQSQKHSSAHNSQTNGLNGGLGSILGSVLGGQLGNVNQPNHHSKNRQVDNDFGLDDVLGSLLGGAMGRQMGQNNSLDNNLGSILGSVLSSGLGKGGVHSGKSGKSMLMMALLPVVLSWIQRNGGLSGALNKVKQLGMQHNVQSWMDIGQTNQNLNTEQVNQLFDANDIHQVAGQVGTDENEVRKGLAELLPEVMNQLTPKGGLQDEQQANREIDEIMSQLSAKLGNFVR